MYYDVFKLFGRKFTMANMDYNHIRLERMLKAAEEKLGFPFKEIVIEGHDWPGAVRYDVVAKLQAACHEGPDKDCDLLEEHLRAIDGYYILDMEDAPLFLNAYLSVGAGHAVALHDVSPTKKVNFDLS